MPCTSSTVFRCTISEAEAIRNLVQRVPGEGIADINRKDIESISVLTGAAAAALYGSNAANGAIVITTKKGEIGKLQVGVSSGFEWLNPFKMPDFQGRYGTGSNGKAGNSSIYSWGPKLNPAAQNGYEPTDFFDTVRYIPTLSLYPPVRTRIRPSSRRQPLIRRGWFRTTGITVIILLSAIRPVS